MIDTACILKMTIATPEKSISSAIDHAIEMAGYCGKADVYSTEVGALIAFAFEDVEIEVRQDSKPDVILRDFLRVKAGCIEGVVGPYPMSALSAEQLARDERITSRSEPANLQASPSQPGAVQRRSPDPQSA